MSLPPLDVPALLRQHHLRPSKGLGQNFLIDEPALAKVIRTAELTPQDVVLEIGAGLGSLTRWLAQSARWVVTVEVDPRLIELLRSILSPFSGTRRTGFKLKYAKTPIAKALSALPARQPGKSSGRHPSLDQSPISFPF